MKKSAWILIDNRPGNSNQAIELAKALNLHLIYHKVEYNCLARLPSCLLGIHPMHVSSKSLEDISSKGKPDIIISSGRRQAALSVYLQKKYNKAAKIIQIMRPGLDSRKFEVIILPQHDTFNNLSPNILRAIGALNNVTEKIESNFVEFSSSYPDIKKFIAVLIGGSSKDYLMDKNEARILAGLLKKISENNSLPLFISFSRRTPEKVKDLFTSNFSWPNAIYDPNSEGVNPYPAFFKNAEFIVSTADSVSMCSEAAATGKPFYIFESEKFNLVKHKYFIQQLIDLGIAKRLNPAIQSLEYYKYEPLDELNRIVEIIKEKFV